MKEGLLTFAHECTLTKRFQLQVPQDKTDNVFAHFWECDAQMIRSVIIGAGNEPGLLVPLMNGLSRGSGEEVGGGWVWGDECKIRSLLHNVHCQQVLPTGGLGVC